MNETEQPGPEAEALRERISALSTAILRISASLDVSTVLQEAVDGARALTGARYGLIATTDDAGTVREFFSSGFTPEEHRQLTGVAGRSQAVRAPPRPSRTDSADRPPRLRALVRPLCPT